MLLLFDEDHKESLLPLSNLSLADAETAIDHSILVLLGKNESGGAALSVQLPDERLIDGLSFLFSESSKLLVSDIDLNDSLLTLTFSDKLRKLILKYYSKHKSEIRQLLQTLAVAEPHYQDLEWRLQVKVGSRTLHNQMEPSVLMKLKTTDNVNSTGTLLQCDIPNLINLAQTLDGAQREAKSQYTRRILRNIK